MEEKLTQKFFNGIALKSIEVTLQQIREKLEKYWLQRSQGDINENEGIKYFYENQMLLKVFDQNYYEKNDQKYLEEKKKEEKIRGNITSTIQKYIDKKWSAGSPHVNPVIYPHYADDFVNGIQRVFDGFKDQADYKRKFSHSENIRKLIERCIPLNSIHPEDIPKVIQELYQDVNNYFSSYNHVSNNRGYLVGIYKNNGELSKENNQFDKNLIAMAFIKHNDLHIKDQVSESLIKDVSSLIAEAGRGKLIGSKVVERLKLCFANVDVDKSIKKINGIAKELWDTLNSDLNDLPNNISNNYIDSYIVDKLFDPKIAENKITKISDQFDELYRNAKFNTGFEREGKALLKQISWLTCFFKSNPYLAVATIAYGALTEFWDMSKSRKEGISEAKRYVKYSLSGSEQYNIEDLAPDRPEFIIYKGQTDLDYIVADGKIGNFIKTSGKKNKFIRAISGGSLEDQTISSREYLNLIHHNSLEKLFEKNFSRIKSQNFLEGGSGNDTIIGYKNNDYLVGEAGDDILDGGEGNDILVGGKGNDTFVFGKKYGIDTIRVASKKAPDGDYILYDDELLQNNALDIRGYKKSDIKKVEYIEGIGTNSQEKRANSKVILYFGEDKKDRLILEHGYRYIKGGGISHSAQSLQRVKFNRDGYTKIEDLFEIVLGDKILSGDKDKHLVRVGGGNSKTEISGGKYQITGGAGKDIYNIDGTKNANISIEDTKSGKVGEKNKIKFRDVHLFKYPKITLDLKKFPNLVDKKDPEEILKLQDGNVFSYDTQKNLIIQYGDDKKIVKIMKNSYSNMEFEFEDGVFKTEDVKKYIRSISKSVKQASAQQRIDPLILDLNGDGIKTTALTEGVHFDLDNNSFAEKTGWVSADDGMLVFDRNENNIIDSGAELFGDQTILSSGKKANGGFEALRELDTNKDGKISSEDADFGKLKVWRDLNQDGLSTSEELFTLEEQGIKSINLANDLKNQELENGNRLVRQGSYEKTDGSQAVIGEYLLSRDTIQSIQKEEIEISTELEDYPELESVGNLYSLKQMMSKDTTGELRKKVDEFILEKDRSKRFQMLDDIIYRWAGVESLAPGSRGGNFDARKLAVIEKMLGMTFNGSQGANPIREAVSSLENAYNSIKNMVYSEFVYQKDLWDFFAGIKMTVDTDSLTLVYDSDAIIQKINETFANDKQTILYLLRDIVRINRSRDILGHLQYQRLLNYYEKNDENIFNVMKLEEADKVFDIKNSNDLTSNPEDYAIMGSDDADQIKTGSGDNIVMSGDGDDIINSNAGADNIYGGIGNDTLYGGSGMDTLYGGDGSDKLYGEHDNDYLDGGSGNDLLVGGYGNDIYALYRGSGIDGSR